MPRVIEIADDTAISLEACCASLAERPFVPTDPDSLAATARLLRQLGNNRDFLVDHIVAELADADADRPVIAYGPQVVLQTWPKGANCFLRANIWPARDDHAMRASGASAFVYGLPHDHPFHFLTLGYFGPGYWSDFYETDYAAITGHVGERVPLRPIGRKRLEEGQILHYRAHIDVHDQLPPDALSVSINVMHSDPSQPWLDQYEIEPAADGATGTLRGIINQGAAKVTPATGCGWRRLPRWPGAKPMRRRAMRSGRWQRPVAAGWWRWRPRRGGPNWPDRWRVQPPASVGVATAARRARDSTRQSRPPLSNAKTPSSFICESWRLTVSIVRPR